MNALGPFESRLSPRAAGISLADCRAKSSAQLRSLTPAELRSRRSDALWRDLLPLDRSPWNQPWLWCALSLIAFAVHYALGPSVGFPILVILPLILASWHSATTLAIGLAALMCLVRFSFHFLWSPQWMPVEASLNAIVRFLVLVVIIALTARVARLQRALLARLTTLEGLLPICCCCHRIRDERQQWERFETYIASRTHAEFTHSICADCTKEYYGDVVA